MGFSRQEYWSGLPCPPPGNLPDPGVKSMFLVSTALTGGFTTPVPLGKPPLLYVSSQIATGEKSLEENPELTFLMT